MNKVLEKWITIGVPCYHVRFHHDVPPCLNKEPVSEFRLKPRSSLDNKYIVEDMWYTPNGLIWKCQGELNIVPLADVIYARLTQGEVVGTSGETTQAARRKSDL